MKYWINSAYGLFALGFALKFFHIPFNAVLMIVALLALVILYALGAMRKKIERVRVLAGFSATLWLTLLLSTTKFYPGTLVVLIAAVALTAITVVVATQKIQHGPLLPLIAPILVALLFYFMPSHKKYHLFNIRMNYEIDRDFYSWDKYSWFLYQNGKIEEAQVASEKALIIASEYADTEWIEFIEDHNRKIKQRSWDSYR